MMLVWKLTPMEWKEFIWSLKVIDKNMMQFSQDDIIFGKVNLAGINLNCNQFNTIRCIVREE